MTKRRWKETHETPFNTAAVYSHGRELSSVYLTVKNKGTVRFKMPGMEDSMFEVKEKQIPNSLHRSSPHMYGR